MGHDRALTGTFDRPDRVVPTWQYGTEARLGWVVGISNLPSQTTMQNYGPEKMARSPATSIPTMTETPSPQGRLCYNGRHEPNT